MLFVVWRKPEHRRIFFAAFIAGMRASRGGAPGLSHGSEETYALMQRHRISSGFALAIASFLLLLRAPPGRRGWLALSAIGFIAFTVVSGWMRARARRARNPRRAWQRGFVRLDAYARGWPRGPSSCWSEAALLSPGVQGRIGEMRAAWSRHFPAGRFDSSGVRLQLLRITGEAAREHWLAGRGLLELRSRPIARLRNAFMQGSRMRMPSCAAAGPSVRNPHDEYVMQLVSGGILALALFIAWLVAGLREGSAHESMAGAALAGVVIAFAAGSLVNSMLLDFMEAHLYVGLLAWLLAENRLGQRGGLSSTASSSSRHGRDRRRAC